MSADLMAVILIAGIAPAVTLFPIVYGFTSPWHRTLLGRSLMVFSVAMALLVDIALVSKLLNSDVRSWVRLSVYTLILIGAWMMLVALVLEKLRAWRLRRSRHRAE